MDSTVRVRQNHYETLGLKPSASDQEVGEAFARAMRLPHLIAQAAQIGVAFDTLGNRAKRRAYDEALGLIPELQPRVASSAISFQISGRFGGVVPASLTQPKATVGSTLDEELIQRPPDPEAPLKQSARDHEGVLPELPIPEFLATGSNRQGYARVRKQQVVDWKYPTFGVGSLILGVVLVGAWAGAHARDAPPKSPESTLTVALPPAKSSSDTVEVPTPPSSSVAEPEFISPAVIERARQRLRARASAGRLGGSGKALERPAGGASVEIGQHPRDLGARLPLPNPVIARTIERIGYACGAVASATAVEADEPGAYKVTCTSGQSYHASPVRGRYHFRRW